MVALFARRCILTDTVVFELPEGKLEGVMRWGFGGVGMVDLLSGFDGG